VIRATHRILSMMHSAPAMAHKRSNWAVRPRPGTLDLNKLFIEPLHIRGSVGHALLAHPVARRAPA
jgi:hypothetical protein